MAELEVLDKCDSNKLFEFGASRLWVDPMDGVSQPEVWLELKTGDFKVSERRRRRSS